MLLAGKKDLGAPLAGKSTLNRLELTPAVPRNGTLQQNQLLRRSAGHPAGDLFWKRTRKRRARSCWTWMPPTRRCTGGRKRVFSTATTGTTATAAVRVLRGSSAVCAAAALEPRRQRRESRGSAAHRAADPRRWPKTRIILRADSASAAKNCWRGAKATRWTTYSALRATALATDHRPRMQQASKSTGVRENRRGCSRSSLIAQEELVAGAARGSQSGTDRGQGKSALSGHLAWQRGVAARKLYEELYCARGEMENRIKEQLSLFSDRLSTRRCGPISCGCTFLRSHTCCWKRCGGWAWRVQSGRKPKPTPSG